MDERTQLVAQFKVGWRECERWQVPLLVQVGASLTSIKSPSGEPGGGGKPKTKPPMDLGTMDLYYECIYEVHSVERDEQRDLSALQKLRTRCRQLLGYDAQMVSLPAVVCHQCGGPLIVARDASSSVQCAEDCGVEYPPTSWLDILAQQGDAA